MENLYFEEVVTTLPIQKNDTEHKLDRYFDDVTANYADYYRNIYKPGKTGLVNGYKSVVYSCANLNASGVADTALRLYVTTDSVQKPTRLKTNNVREQVQSKLRSKYKLKNDVIVEEVIDHPAIKLLEDVNSEIPFLDEFLLIELTQLYLEICGEAYWWPVVGPLGVPIQIYLLPSQCVFPERNPNSTRFVDRYKYQWENLERTFQPGELIQFLSPGLVNPYTEGLSPEEASLESSVLINKLKSMMTGVLSKEARPDAIVSPKQNEASWGADEAKMYERQINMKFGSGKSGGIMTIEEPIDFNILNFPPRDLARLDIQTNERLEVANTFSVPIALIDSKSINKMTLEAALMQHGRKALRPRCKRFAGVLNKQFLTRYDTTGRLFFEFDDPVPEDEEIKLQKNTQLKICGAITSNEVRDEYNLPPHPDGDELEAMSTPGSGSQQRDQKRDSGEAEK